MRDMMQRALTAISVRRDARVSDRKNRRSGSGQPPSVKSEDWGMSSEDALKASMVSGYK